MIGNTISHYHILEKIGEGGMGIVYKAKDIKLDRIVALKLLPEHLNTNSTEKNRFIREAKAAAALNHPNVCTIHEIQETGEIPFIAMEYIEGHNLSELIKSNSNKRLSIEQSICIAIQIGEALEEAHSKGIIHRDIKSENIMVNSKNQVKVMDFGLAKFKDSTQLTETLSLPDNFVYMAPEQIQRNDVDKRSDIYSLGVVLYEMLTGHLPYKTDYGAKIMYSILNEEPIQIQQFLPNIPSELLHLLNRVLEKDPADRYQSITDLISELQRLKKKSYSSLSKSSLYSKPIEILEINKSKVIRKIIFWLVTVFLFVAVAILGINEFIRHIKPDKKVVNYQDMKIKHLTTSGNVWEAAVSSDGKYLAKVIFDGGVESIWLSQIETNSNVQIADTESVNYRGLHFSSDDNYLYYIKKYQNTIYGDLYKMPVLGGRAELILSGIPEYITFSPEDTKVAYVKDTNKLFIATLDSINKDVFLNYQEDNIEISCPAWSSDGKNIAFINIAIQPQKIISIKSINIETKKVTNVAYTNWFHVTGLIWLPDNNGLIATSSFQLYYVDYLSGDISRITNDINTYRKISLSEKGSVLVTVQWQWITNIWLLDQNNRNVIEKISSSGIERDGCLGLTWSPCGKIIFCSYKNMRYDLWEMNPDGTERKQLTFFGGFIYSPTIGNDSSKYVVSTLKENNRENIWRMDRDGSNLTQLTFGNTDGFPNLTPDGKWIIYNTRSIENGSLMKVSIEGGKPEILIKGQEGNPTISPDGKLIAYHFKDEENQVKTSIISVDDGEVIKIFNEIWAIGWGSDSKHICFSESNKLWMLSLEDGEKTQIFQYENSEWISYYDWEPGGDRLAVVRSKNICDAVLIKNFLK